MGPLGRIRPFEAAIEFRNTGPVLLDANPTEPFSTANVFGLYMTIGLCILVQQYGSLVYPKPKGILGRLVFFFWRLNPITGLLEAAYIGIAFADAIWGGSWESVRDTAAVLQSLRRHGHDEFGDWVTLLELQKSSARDQTDPLGNRSSDPSYPNDQTAAESNLLEDQQRLQPPSPIPIPQAHLASMDVGPGNAEALAAGPGQSPTTAPRRKVSSKANIILNLFAASGMLLSIIKLAAVPFPHYIRIPALFLVTSWLFIQALYLFPQPTSLKHYTPSEARSKALRIIRLENLLYGRQTRRCINMLFAPLLAYLAFAIQTKPGFSCPSPECDWIDALALLFLIICQSALSLRGYWNRLGNNRAYVAERVSAYLPWLSPRRTSTSRMSFNWRAVGESAALVLFVFVLTRLPKPAPKPVGRWTGFSSFFVWGWYAGHLYLCVFAPAKGFTMVEFKRYGWLRSFFLFQNVLVTLLFFAAGLIMYEGNEAQKPRWLDWLG